ncbi:questin oxidase family protein [Pseudorhodoferax sp.]|uniref:questin oxidase family protein n=1 Tax=Pseudorhodoferax sp. TaxID=1993553 RepID=UPI002DD66CCB|nr:questin oxidase family protein [Pseudorhodoferax sp.]
MQKLSRAELHDILWTYRRFDPLYGDRLANHLPMAITALWQLGVDAAAIHRFSSEYAKRLKPRRDHGPSEPARMAQVGTHTFEANAAYFSAQFNASSCDEVLQLWIPRLIPGVAASAFHGLIRTAYAVEAGYRAELADALAYWMAEYVHFPGRAPVSALPPAETIDAAISHFSKLPPYPGTIVDRMAAAARDPWFDGDASTLAGINLQEIRREVLALYARYDDVTLLHTVTAIHAMRVLEPYWQDNGSACAYLWQGILLAIAGASADLPVRRNQATSPIPDAPWPAIAARARDSVDEHVIKLVYTAYQESLVDGSELYRLVAARKAGSPIESRR